MWFFREVNLTPNNTRRVASNSYESGAERCRPINREFVLLFRAFIGKTNQFSHILGAWRVLYSSPSRMQVGHQLRPTPCAAHLKSEPVSDSLLRYPPVAQLVEQEPFKFEVVGSIPTGRTQLDWIGTNRQTALRLIRGFEVLADRVFPAP